ncbi:phage tail tape measure C-terminal domain-containing protein, partial [Providencia sp. PROV180]
LALLGGPVGAAMMAGGALFYFSEKADEAKQKAIGLKDALYDTKDALMQLTNAQLAVKELDLRSQMAEAITERNKIQKDVNDLQGHIKSASRGEYDSWGFLGKAYNQKVDTWTDELTKAKGQIDDINSGYQKANDQLKLIENVRDSLAKGEKPKQSNTEGGLPPPKLTGSTDKDKSKTKSLNDYQQLRKSIESEHFSSLQKIQASEKENNDKLASLHKKGFVSQAEMQRLILLNTENHQQKRLELAEKYDPYATIIRKEKEAVRELNELRQSNLLSEQQYYSASLQLHNDYTKQKLTEEANKKALPSYDLAGEIDPVVKLQNQLNEQQALYEAYRNNDLISQERYQELMIAATNRSKEAQLEAAKELYGAQGNWQKMQMNLLETVEQRTSNALTGILTGSKSFSETLQELSASLAQSIIQDLIRIAMQAMITNALTGLFGGLAGGGASGVSSAASASGTGAMGMSTGWQSYVPNAKGGMYNTPGLSAYSGQVIDAPTFFPFAKGGVPSLGLMGEAGPEAIMPLTRSKDGSLGVRAQLPKIDMP